jgi:hypothetical protein
VYDYRVAVHDCLVDLGLDLGDPPARAAQLAGDPAWSPYDEVAVTRRTTAGTYEDLVRSCPPQPVGGFGSWSPGDPVTPVE